MLELRSVGWGNNNFSVKKKRSNYGQYNEEKAKFNRVKQLEKIDNEIISDAVKEVK